MILCCTSKCFFSIIRRTEIIHRVNNARTNWFMVCVCAWKNYRETARERVREKNLVFFRKDTWSNVNVKTHPENRDIHGRVNIVLISNEIRMPYGNNCSAFEHKPGGITNRPTPFSSPLVELILLISYNTRFCILFPENQYTVRIARRTLWFCLDYCKH